MRVPQVCACVRAWSGVRVRVCECADVRMRGCVWLAQFEYAEMDWSRCVCNVCMCCYERRRMCACVCLRVCACVRVARISLPGRRDACSKQRRTKGSWCASVRVHMYVRLCACVNEFACVVLLWVCLCACVLLFSYLAERVLAVNIDVLEEIGVLVCTRVRVRAHLPACLCAHACVRMSCAFLPSRRSTCSKHRRTRGSWCDNWSGWTGYHQRGCVFCRKIN